MIAQYIFGGFIIFIGLFFLFIGIYCLFQDDDGWFVSIFFSIIFLLAGITIINDKPFPIKQDILDDNAYYYYETIHITNIDTIKIHEILWKQENF